jgi:hypothetical protein
LLFNILYKVQAVVFLLFSLKCRPGIRYFIEVKGSLVILPFFCFISILLFIDLFTIHCSLTKRFHNTPLE